MKVVATTREAQGTGASRRLRLTGKVPGIVYGGTDAPANIELDHNTLFHALRKEVFHSSILDLEVDGKGSTSVLLRDVQMHPFKQQVLHIDFQRVAADKAIHVRVPIHYINGDTSPAVKMSANVVSHVMNDIEVICLPKDLPEFIEIDLGNLEANGTVHVSDLKLPEGVTVTPGADEVIASASMPQEEKAIEPTVVAEPAAAATAAAAAAPAEKGDKK